VNKITLDNLSEHQQRHTAWNSWWEHDARGIPLCRVCDECREVALSRYKPEVLGFCGNYEDVISEPIEPED